MEVNWTEKKKWWWKPNSTKKKKKSDVKEIEDAGGNKWTGKNRRKQRKMNHKKKGCTYNVVFHENRQISMKIPFEFGGSEQQWMGIRLKFSNASKMALPHLKTNLNYVSIPRSTNRWWENRFLLASLARTQILKNTACTRNSHKTALNSEQFLLYSAGTYTANTEHTIARGMRVRKITRK